MNLSRQHALELRAEANPKCPECVSRLSGPEVYTVTRFRDNALLAWDIDLAAEICSDGRVPVQVPHDVLDDILQVNGTTPEHIDHVDLGFPGIACAVDWTPEGAPVMGLIDGSHRAARSRRDRVPFFAYFLSDDESARCQNTVGAHLCAHLESLLRKPATSTNAVDSVVITQGGFK
jgi:hypothetical protein